MVKLCDELFKVLMAEYIFYHLSMTDASEMKPKGTFT